MSNLAPPPFGFRVATSTREVFEAADRARRDNDRSPLPLRVYVDREWMPGGVDIAIFSAPRRPVTRNVPVVWGDPPFGSARRLPFDRIAIPVPTVDATTRIPPAPQQKPGSQLVEVTTTSDVKVSAIHLRDGSTGVSLLVPLGDVTTVHVGDLGRVLTATTQRDLPPVAVGLTPADARSLARTLMAKADEVDPDGATPPACTQTAT